jgi:hypothetical protein
MNEVHNSVQLGEVLGSVAKRWYSPCNKGGLTDIMPIMITKKSVKQEESHSET